MKKCSVLGLMLLLAALITACGTGSTAAQQEKEAFSYQEISDIFDLKESDVLTIYGQPDDIIESPYFEYGTSKEYDFGDNRFGFVSYNEQADTYLYFAYLADNLISAPRDIQIGDDLKTVLKAFPDGSDKTRYPLEGYDDQHEAEYRLLYGEYMYMESYGILIYQQDEAVEIEYADQGAVMRLHIDEDKLTNIEYMIPFA